MTEFVCYIDQNLLPETSGILGHAEKVSVRYFFHYLKGVIDDALIAQDLVKASEALPSEIVLKNYAAECSKVGKW